MKKKLLLLALLPTLLFAQTPFGKDATWHFSFEEFGYRGFIKIEYAADTVLKGLVWQKFKTSGIGEIRTGPNPSDLMQGPFSGVYYLRTQNDSVFTMNPDTTAQLVYDFNAQVGDTWLFAPADTGMGCKDLPVATVVSIGYDSINGQLAKYWLVQNPMDTVNQGGNLGYGCSSPWCINEKIYRDFGGFSFVQLFGPTPNLCNGGSFQLSWYGLRCFSNSNLNFQLTNKACNYWSLIGLEEDDLSIIKIYPNPSSGVVFIDSENDIAKTEIYNITGQKLRVYQNEKIIELPQQSGVYFLHISFKNGEQAVQKVLRN